MIPLGSGFALPDEAVTQTFGVLAKRGAGKSNVGAVMAEGMYKARLPFVVIDPVGAWWGLRSSRSGKGPGLSIPIFGGYRGDVPLERGGGELIANLVVDERLSCVVDVSAFESERAKREFLASFAEHLFRRKGQPGKDDPLHMFLEEADDYAPQRGGGVEINRCLGAFQRIVKQGRARGLGATMITQRSAALNKDLLTQLETLIVLRTTSPQDRKAIQGWVEYHDEDHTILSSLSTLPTGTGWVWSPWLDVVKKVKFSVRSTYDSGATPSLKSKRATATLADVDLESIRDQMAATIERVKAEDPRELKREIADLRRQLREQTVHAVPEPMEVPVFPEEMLERVKAAHDAAGNVLIELQDIVSAANDMERRPALKVVEGGASTGAEHRGSEYGFPGATSQARSRGTKAGPPRSVHPPSTRTSDTALGKAERSILSVLAQKEEGRRSIRQTALLAGYAANGGGFRNAVSALRTKGYVEGRGDLTITPDGLDAIAGDYEVLPPAGEPLLQYWMGRSGKAERTILSVLSTHQGGPMPLAEIAMLADYEVNGGGFRNAVSRLRTLDLVSGRGELTLAQELVP